MAKKIKIGFTDESFEQIQSIGHETQKSIIEVITNALLIYVWMYKQRRAGKTFAVIDRNSVVSIFDLPV